VLAYAITAGCLIFGGGVIQAQTPAGAQAQDEELQMGQEVFNELKAKGEIIESSPLYDQLKPIADSITQAAQPRYNHPFKFYLVHEQQPNAFATPGGNVYVVDSLLYFVKNKEQLAGTLCHEVSHTIHHDTVTLMEKQQKIEEREVAAAVLMGPTKAHILAIALVWLFQDFQNANMNQVPQLLSDHPNDQNRVNALEVHFRQNPSVFGKFNPDPKSGTPVSVPKGAPEAFLQ